jgi:hypothetical protein
MAKKFGEGDGFGKFLEYLKSQSQWMGAQDLSLIVKGMYDVSTAAQQLH